MIRVLLVDDEPLARSVIREYLEEEKEIEILAECNDGFEALKFLQENEADLLFLDIQMPKINGFEMLELLDKPPAVIFTTAFDEFAIKAFEASAIDYLLKPFSRERFQKALAKVRDKSLQKQMAVSQEELSNGNGYLKQSNRVVIRDQGKVIIIPLSDIFYFEASDDYVRIHSRQGKFLKTKTLSSYEKALAGQSFIRVHRSYLLNVDFISRIEPHEKESYLAILTTGDRVPVSKSGYSKIVK